jgi:LEA14-like dessication related protein
MIGLDVANPNRFDLILKSFEYTVYLNGEAVGNGHLDRALLIPAAATTRVQAPLAATFKNLGRSLKAVIGGKDVSYKIEGKAEIKAFLISQTFPFSKEGILNPKP